MTTAAPPITAERVLTAAGWRERVEIVVADGVIGEIRPLAHDVRAAHDLIVPGFVDLQVNGVDDVDVAAADGADWDRLDTLLAHQGVTTWCPTLVTSPMDRYPAAIDRIAAARRRPDECRPSIAGIHLEGPFLGGAPGAHPPRHLQPIDLDWLAALPDDVTLVTLAPELERAAEATALLAGRGVVVSLGHSTPTAEQVEACITAGALLVTHLYNGMSGLHHRSPGLAALALTDDRVAASMIADGVHVDPVMMRLAWRTKPDGIVLVTDAVAWRAGTAGTIGLEVRDGAPRLPDGTLAGSAVTMVDAVRRSVAECGATLEQAVAAASSRPAHLLGLHDRGVIAPGRRADLVALADTGAPDDMTVAQTWARGHALLGDQR